MASATFRFNLGNAIGYNGHFLTQPTLYDEGTGGLVKDCTPQVGAGYASIGTAWDINEGYNNLLPSMQCVQFWNGKAPVGSVQIALAQLLYHWQVVYQNGPQTYNWLFLGQYQGQNYENQHFIRFLGEPQNLNVSYNCAASFTANPERVITVLRDRFNYNNPGIYQNYNYQTLVNNMSSHQFPVVYLDGYYTGVQVGNQFLVFPITHRGWLCDGYRYSISQCHSEKYLHMVWGKGPNFVNWVFEDNWNSNFTNNNNRLFNYNRKMITNINPN